MKHIARALASMGRNGDSELIHATPKEIRFLQGVAAQHGLGGLTKNPKTGLMEASLFEDILPIVGGVGGGALGALTGNPWGVAAGSALGSGLGSKLAGKSDQDALRNAAVSGAMGGLGSYMGGMGAAAPTQDAMLAGQNAGLEGATQGAALPAGGMGATGPGTGADMFSATTPNPTPWAVQPSGIQSLPSEIQPLPAGGMTATGPLSRADVTAAGMQGTPVVATDTPGMGSKALGWMGEHPIQAAMLGSMGVNALLPAYNPTPQRHQVRMAGASHSNRALAPTPAGPYGGAEKNYFANNAISDYTQDPSTTRWQYAEGGMVEGGLFNAPLMPDYPREGIAGLKNNYADGGSIDPARQWVDPNLAGQQAGERTNAQQAWQAQQTAAPAAPTANTGPYQQDWYSQMAAQHPSGYVDPGQGDAPSQGFFHTHNAGETATRGALAVGTGGLSEVARGVAPNAVSGVSDTVSHWGDSLGFAKGGVLNLRQPKQSLPPMFLRGAGDGMSDSIPAQIDGQGQRPHQPIRVADGEYVVPADVVSHLGNGSSNAGSRQMDKMVSGIRKARTGKTKQAPQVNPSKYLPK